MIIEAGQARVWPRKDAAAHGEHVGRKGSSGKGKKTWQRSKTTINLVQTAAFLAVVARCKQSSL